ncbi:SDR family NAD(P)-dependent oxidoreductase [Streptomyces himalayensis]|uniref:SDR family NAD(P)-dependent oxidoreductase n=1 Tax=Streptomyces himalayensis subsp. himalayensis TaxID=2756131 RepID=A0A7W0DR13_9ACTN|nr:SDR family NAD(P)-dependent oxidoreductase [Streptomyces himalayensis]MBA2949657.1 SDR family NAD(P)-dependent oxidoreductase [Streptomyces himalayensis subsp. himalayensis]
MHPHDRRAVDDPEDNHNATIVLTGATTGIGRATAMALAERAGHLILHGLERQDDVADLLDAVQTTMRADTRLSYLQADYSDLAQVERLARQIRAATDRIDILINNAARPGPPARTVSGAGHEITFQTNYLAPVLLTSRLIDLIGDGRRGRIVNVASATHLSATLLLDDLSLAHHPYSASTAYAHSKLALVTYSCWLAVHRPSRSLDVVSMHPGVISTRLLHAMFSVAGDRPEHAAANLRYVASRRDDNGAYYDERNPAPPNPQASDRARQDRLHDATFHALNLSPQARVTSERQLPS